MKMAITAVGTAFFLLSFASPSHGASYAIEMGIELTFDFPEGVTISLDDPTQYTGFGYGPWMNQGRTWPHPDTLYEEDTESDRTGGLFDYTVGSSGQPADNWTASTVATFEDTVLTLEADVTGVAPTYDDWASSLAYAASLLRIENHNPYLVCGDFLRYKVTMDWTQILSEEDCVNRMGIDFSFGSAPVPGTELIKDTWYEGYFGLLGFGAAFEPPLAGGWSEFTEGFRELANILTEEELEELFFGEDREEAEAIAQRAGITLEQLWEMGQEYSGNLPVFNDGQATGSLPLFLMPSVDGVPSVARYYAEVCAEGICSEPSNVIPEPATGSLLITVLCGLALLRRKR